MPRAIKIILIIFFIAFAASFFLTPIRSDNDVWWHVKTGKIIVESRALPANDILAYTSEEIPWHNHEWLAQVIFFAVYTLGDGTEQSGFQMVILLVALLLIAAYLILLGHCWRETKSLPIAILAAVWAVLMSRRTIYPRPPVFSYGFFAFYLWLFREVDEKRLRRRWLWALPPLMVFWVNIHGGFMLGLIVIGSYGLTRLVQTLMEKKPLSQSSGIYYFIILGASLFATLMNPYTYNLYLLPARVMSDTGLVRIIPELHSPDFFYTIAFEAMILFLMGASFALRKKIISLPEGLLIIFFMHQGIQHVRHVPLVGIVAAPVCARIVKAFSESISSEWLKARAPAFISLGVIMLIAWTLLNHREGESFLERNRRFFAGEGYYENSFPVAEANFIAANNFSGRMFNQINDAGFLIWRLSPERHKVFTDSRYDIFGGKFMRHEQIIQLGLDRKIYPDDETWDELLERWKVNFIVISADAPVNSQLEKSGSWEMVYHRLPRYARSSREGYKIHIRNVPENKDLIERCRRSFSAAQNLSQ
ncbi:MAG TPA: hypothetical protein PKW18_09180 [Candidatus Sumerlaeota bacterium]|nr:MAG: hypothetical protein BWY12_00508 [candidate division BRC1 bacterium ADurb.Bin183]HOE63119.1 hypothetical protein [Candidatus Sumerlaeota bacterium]HRR31078.1 hypothetical protein [Candidatus Sumerlaeia bacterium]HON51501.1 hypothetical protein [Candidatus Sumerlaeota bacterium]HOR65292.1 hypothetical protein [Candidatus Sumerlaeota bacterium]